MCVCGGSSGKSKCHDFILETWASIISEFAWIIWLSHSKHYRDAITLIHPSASMPSVFLYSLSSTLRTKVVLGLWRGSLPLLNPLFSSHLDCRGKLLFPKLGDAFSYAGRHFSELFRMKQRKGIVLSSLLLAQEKGHYMGMGKKRDENPVPYVVRPKRGSLLFSLIQNHNLLLLLDDTEKIPLFLLSGKGGP